MEWIKQALGKMSFPLSIFGLVLALTCCLPVAGHAIFTPNVGWRVPPEWMFYAFIGILSLSGLSPLLIVSALLSEKEKRKKSIVLALIPVGVCVLTWGIMFIKAFIIHLF